MSNFFFIFSKRTQRSFIDPSTLNQTDIDRLENGKPINVSQGLNVKRNLKTNKLEGVPIQWAKKYKLPLQVDMEKTVDTKHLPRQTRPSGQLPKTILDFIENKQSIIGFNSKISSVFGSRAESKLTVDRHSKYGIKNLTSHLLEQIQLSQLSQDQISQPQQLIDLITIQDQPVYESKKESKLLTTNEFKMNLSKVKIIEENPAERYNFPEQIGKGSMCKVFKACSKLNELIMYAVKIIKLDETRTLQKIKQEIAAMQMCYSSNIIDYHFTFLFRQSLFMFMQYMDYGNLTRFIHYFFNEGKKIPESVIWFIVFEILKGLACIHTRWQIHRDLKSDNILINMKGQIKISDFGYALQFTKEKTCCKDVVGTPAWMAPELITKKDYNESVDIWSLGIIITQLVNGQPNYLRMKPLKAMYMIVSEEPPQIENSSSELKNFVRKCLQKDPSKRADIKQLLNDPHIKALGLMKNQKQQFKRMLIESFQR